MKRDVFLDCDECLHSGTRTRVQHIRPKAIAIKSGVFMVFVYIICETVLFSGQSAAYNDFALGFYCFRPWQHGEAP